MFSAILSLIFLQCCITIVAADSVPLRNDPRLPSHGTKNWQQLLHGTSRFSPRHSHATCIFPCPDSQDQCIWVTGGYSDLHRSFNPHITEHENADVWYSHDGANWNQVTELYGDFLQGVGNVDAKVGGYTAPWYGRYGHSLNAMDSDGDGIADVMILAGGFSPLPSNDLWITKDGFTWRFGGFAPWPERAYHGATVYQNKLWILGGSPLSNDVWAGTLTEDKTKDVGCRLVWEQMPEAPWTPRAGFCVVDHQLRQEDYLAENSTEADSALTTEYMYVIGGLAHPLPGDDGTRSRNDVWRSVNGTYWEQVLPQSGKAMPWGARSFHSCATLQIGNSTATPRIYITGGGYMGRKGNNEVYDLEAYTDAWWSYDGSDWARINYEEGSIHKSNLFSTNEWTEANIDGKKVYRGKWGHSLEAFRVSKSLSEGGEAVSNTDSNVCDGAGNETAACAHEEKVPSLFVIGGKLEDGPLVNDVFVSLPGVHCEIDGITCSRNGECGQGTQGCICHSKNLLETTANSNLWWHCHPSTHQIRR